MNLFGKEKPNEQTIRQIPAISLAYIGDAVFDLYIRNQVIAQHPRMNSNRLNQIKIKCVKASAQALIAHELLPDLSEDETAVLKRGRNAKSLTVPKNAKLSDYKYATGYEALVGYLYLMDQNDRLQEILCTSYQICKQKIL